MNTTLNPPDHGAAARTSPVSTQAVENRNEQQIHSVKQEVFEEFQNALGANDHLLRLAMIEAEALAHQTGFPQLLFPLLAAEKARNAARWQFRQRFLLRNTLPYPLAA